MASWKSIFNWLYFYEESSYVSKKMIEEKNAQRYCWINPELYEKNVIKFWMVWIFSL